MNNHMTDMTDTITYCDGLLSGGRSPALWLLKGGRVHVFRGKNIPGIAVIVGDEYTKNGKWSSTTYRIVLGAGVRHVVLSAPLHGRTWPEATFAEALARFQREAGAGVDPASFEEAIREYFPRTWERWEATAQALEELDSPEGESEVHVWTYQRGPRRAPFWACPLFIGPTGTDPVGVDLPWEDPMGEGIPRIKAGLRVPLAGDQVAHVVDVRYAGGRNGGSYTLRVALPEGWTLGSWVPEEDD